MSVSYPYVEQELGLTKRSKCDKNLVTTNIEDETMGIRIGKWKKFLCGYEVPEEVLRRDFDYMDAPQEQDQFIKHRGRYYHIGDFMPIDIEYWDGVCTDSYFSGVVIKISKDGESYKIGAYYV